MDAVSSYGTYVACRFDEATLDKIQEIQEALPIFNPVPREELHSTIIYSTEEIPFLPADFGTLLAESCHLRVFETPKGNVLVLAYESPHMNKRFSQGMMLGATYDFDEYIPHITIAKDVGTHPYDGVYEFPIMSAYEYMEELDPS
ncbi:hypothetical protein OFDDKENP_00023 [Aeromonas phage B614]|nr:hypothetical protein OFDDKENP_00023 [Aeromonas phage B614]UYD58234.1 hypothetical protein JNEOFJEA_00155 [Aeromonas phage UP87]UYD58348.1 hypothetical protein IPAKJDPM_00005 [Aeromonas phage avDM14-QBC]UYD58812.1 hypothetical protein HNNIDBEH_00236 [Aeromonas phage avDM10-HWA]UYD58885.1 hypothetical protein OFOPOMKI_00018 [Aeromonas phage avDM7-IJDJ]UYD59945.1 hypothetical protein LEHPIFIF_00172 [Aeromonas phage avDM9-HANS]